MENASSNDINNQDSINSQVASNDEASESSFRVPDRFDSASYMSPPPTNRESIDRDDQNRLLNAPQQRHMRDIRSATPSRLSFDRQIEEQEVQVKSEFKFSVQGTQCNTKEESIS